MDSDAWTCTPTPTPTLVLINVLFIALLEAYRGTYLTDPFEYFNPHHFADSWYWTLDWLIRVWLIRHLYECMKNLILISDWLWRGKRWMTHALCLLSAHALSLSLALARSRSHSLTLARSFSFCPWRNRPWKTRGLPTKRWVRVRASKIESESESKREREQERERERDHEPYWCQSSLIRLSYLYTRSLLTLLSLQGSCMHHPRAWKKATYSLDTFHHFKPLILFPSLYAILHMTCTH
jgi:hypothetical protein